MQAVRLATVLHGSSGQFSSFLFRVEERSTNTTQLISGKDDLGDAQWLELVRSIGGARDIWIANELITYYILRALDQADGGHTNALPALDTLFVEDPMTMNDLSWEALLPFITLRSLSGRHVQGNMPCSQCDIRHASFRQQRELKHHLVDRHQHTYRRLCSYCGVSSRNTSRGHILRFFST